MLKIIYTIFLLIVTVTCIAQEQKKSLFDLPDKAIASLTKKYQNLDKQIEKETENYIVKLEKQEAKLQKKLHTKDSTKAKEQLAGMQEHYKKLRARMQKATTNPQLANEYFPQVDSVATTAKYLLASNPNNASLKELNQSIATMQSKLQASVDIKRMMKTRKDQLRNQLKDLGVTKQLDGISKETFYYKQQIAEYKTLLKDKDKAQQKLLGLVRESNVFKDFMKKNSFLAKLFPQQGAGGASNVFPAGLQTREEILNELQTRFGSNNPLANGSGVGGGGNFIQDQLNKAKTGFNKLKQDANKAGDNVADADMPNFKPNTQKSKSFLKRLDFGMNMQSVKSNVMLPTTSDIAITVGYKLNDKSTIGIGAAYKLGWGNGWQDIKLSTQGWGCRSFVDVKLFPKAKQGVGRLFKNLWISGGYELNYLSELKEKNNPFSSIQYSVWQESALMGLSKKYSKGKKKAQVQLLYNFLYKQTIPQQQPLVFRVGWGL
jgi:hypothetical protein